MEGRLVSRRYLRETPLRLACAGWTPNESESEQHRMANAHAHALRVFVCFGLGLGSRAVEGLRVGVWGSGSRVEG
eukprot:222578-Rhodomonas_salina.1